MSSFCLGTPGTALGAADPSSPQASAIGAQVQSILAFFPEAGVCASAAKRADFVSAFLISTTGGLLRIPASRYTSAGFYQLPRLSQCGSA
jgi:hypothetical protein